MMNVRKIIKRYYNLDIDRVKKLNGYENENFLVYSKGSKYIFKTYAYSDLLFRLVQAENKVLLQLSCNDGFLIPTPIPTIDLRYELKHEFAGQVNIVRLLSYLEGKSIGFVESNSDLYKTFGQFLAKMDIALSKIDNEVIKKRKSEWNIIHFEMNAPLLNYINDPIDRKMLKSVFDDYRTYVVPSLHLLNCTLIHNDANDYNVMVSKGKISGIIDFGDLAYAPRINELAVAIAYAGLCKENPIRWAKIIVQSYIDVIPLDNNELDLLYYFITARLATSILNANYSRMINPENRYAYSSEKEAMKTLKWWLENYTKKPMV